MALMVGAMTIHNIQPGPQVMTSHPQLFWGLIASMWIGNLMLVVLNLPLIGLVLGPMMEENFRRALLLSRGDFTTFITRPLSASLLAIAVFLVILVALPAIRKKREQTFVEEDDRTPPRGGPCAQEPRPFRGFFVEI